MMNTSYMLVLGFSAWALLLLLMIAVVRFSMVAKGEHKPHNFTPDGEEMSAFSKRLYRAHANCYENLPLLLGVIFVAALTNNLALTDPLALTFLACRILQSLAHLYSGRSRVVLIRFAFFAVQCGILIYWLINLALHMN